MNAIEIRNLSKSFRGLYAVDHLNMTVPVGAIYGFIGENGSGKSTTEKLICGHLVPDSGEIRLFGKDYTDPGVRVRVGALIENTGCFPNSSVWDNLMMQAINLGLEHPADEINRVLQIVRMEDSAKIKFKSCSLGIADRHCHGPAGGSGPADSGRTHQRPGHGRYADHAGDPGGYHP